MVDRHKDVRCEREEKKRENVGVKRRERFLVVEICIVYKWCFTNSISWKNFSPLLTFFFIEITGQAGFDLFVIITIPNKGKHVLYYKDVISFSYE